MVKTKSKRRAILSRINRAEYSALRCNLVLYRHFLGHSSEAQALCLQLDWSSALHHRQAGKEVEMHDVPVARMHDVVRRNYLDA